MCGRFVQSYPAEVYAEVLGVECRARSLCPNYNAGYGQQLLVADAYALQPRRWGMGYRNNINARGETFLGLRSFADAGRHGRCLVPMEGFYEWHQGACYRFGKSGTILVAAGIQDGSRFAILTREAIPPVTEFHNRMPVLLRQEHWSEWTTPSLDLGRVAQLAASYLPLDGWDIHVMPRSINDPKENFYEV